MLRELNVKSGGGVAGLGRCSWDLVQVPGVSASARLSNKQRIRTQKNVGLAAKL